jgi:hypothetical protein
VIAELKELYAMILVIDYNYILEGFVTLIQSLSVNELNAIMESLKTEYWLEGTGPV